MDILKNILEEIKNGKKEFTPTGQLAEDINDFQIIAKAIGFANSKGFINGYLPHRNTETSDFYYDLVMVINGLSYQGELFLENYDKQEKKMEPKDDIFLIKPSFFGVGVDLKALWNRWIRKKW